MHKEPLTLEQHLKIALGNVDYLRRWVHGNEERISADDAATHLRAALDLVRTPVPTEYLHTPRPSFRTARAGV